MLPVLPPEFEALIAAPGQPFCDRVMNRFRFRLAVMRVIGWMIDSDTRQLSEEFKTMLCEIDCEDVEATTSTTSCPPPSIDGAVSGVSVDGCIADVSWNYPGGATSVDIKVAILDLSSGTASEAIHHFESPTVEHEFTVPDGERWCFFWRLCSDCGCSSYISMSSCVECESATTTTTTTTTAP